MPKIAKQIDWGVKSGGGSSKGGDDILPFVVQDYIFKVKDDGWYAGLGDRGLCNEPMFDSYREGDFLTSGKDDYIDDDGVERLGWNAAAKHRLKGEQWGVWCKDQLASLNQYSCYFLMGSPFLDDDAYDFEKNEATGEGKKVVAQSTYKDGKPTKTLSNSQVVNYPYITIEKNAQGLISTYEVYHTVANEKQIRALQSLGYSLKVNPSDSNEYRALMSVRGGEAPDELYQNKGAWFGAYGNKNLKEKKELAQDMGAVPASSGEEAYISASKVVELVGDYDAFIMKTNLVSDIGYAYNADFSANVCNDSDVDPDDRKADCGGCEGTFAKSPVWPPYKSADLINCIACDDIIPGWPGTFHVGPDVDEKRADEYSIRSQSRRWIPECLRHRSKPPSQSNGSVCCR